MQPPSTAAASLLGIGHRRWALLCFLISLAPYLVLAYTTVRSVGIVGEVALGWIWGPPVDVWIDLDSPPSDHILGPFHARQTRPLERLVVGAVDLPLAVNSYTGGLPDWPARMVHAITGSTRAVQGLHLLMGAGILTAVFAFLRQYAGLGAAMAATMVLGTRWDFVFYRSVLGGTEAVLVASTLALIWAIWSRRWRGGPHGLLVIAAAIGIGLHAKLTFVVVLLAVSLSAALLRSDRSPMGPPEGSSAPRTVLAVLLPLLPLIVANLHQQALEPPFVHSHDHLQLQLDRVANALRGGHTPGRESLGNLVDWMFHPLAFLGRAYQVGPIPAAPWLLASVGWLLMLVGLVPVWRRPHPTPRDALLRFCSVLLPIGASSLLLVARDLHHLATMSVVVALVVGLAADQIAGLRFPARSIRRLLATLLLVSPWLASGAIELHQTDTVVRDMPVPTFRADGQQELAELLSGSGATSVWVSDYEAMGSVELALQAQRADHVQLHHAWGAASRRARGESTSFLRDLLGAASGAHLLVVDASAPMIYNLRARGASLQRSATKEGVRLTEVGRLTDGTAVLYKVETIADQREASP